MDMPMTVPSELRDRLGRSPGRRPRLASGLMAVLLPACASSEAPPLLAIDARPATTTPDAASIPHAPPAALEPTITIAPASATGPDRFFGVAFDARGNIYAIGQVAESTLATADIATVVARFTPAGALDTSFGDHGFAVHNVV